MNKDQEITGIILAGGKSSRMGSEKGLMLYDNEPFVQHIITALQPIANEILVVSSNSDYDKFGIKRVEDIVKDSGPIAGLHAGLLHSKTEQNIVVSCDVPLVTTSLLKKLLKHKEENYDVIQFEAKGKTIPLIALYKKRCATKCLELLTNDERRLQQLVAAVHSKTILVSRKEQFLVTNINTVDDVKAITNAIDS